MNVREFVRDRNAAFLSLDEVTIRAFCRKYGVRQERDHVVFWAGIHKARCKWSECPPHARAVSERWLLENGFQVPAAA